MRTVVGFLLFYAGLFFVAFLIHISGSPTKNAKLIPELTATGLVSDYYENEVRAESRFKGKVAFITGKVFSVEKMSFRTHLMLRIEGTDSGTVNCFLERGQKKAAALLNAGDKITIKGKIAGKDSRGVKVMSAIIHSR